MVLRCKITVMARRTFLDGLDLLDFVPQVSRVVLGGGLVGTGHQRGRDEEIHRGAGAALVKCTRGLDPGLRCA